MDMHIIKGEPKLNARTEGAIAATDAILRFLRAERDKFAAAAKDNMLSDDARGRCEVRAAVLETEIAYIERGDHLTDGSVEPDRAPVGITVKRRFSDYHASIDGSGEAQWGCGKSIDEAVGSVVRNQQERLGLKINL
jgi:hypothetical protein